MSPQFANILSGDEAANLGSVPGSRSCWASVMAEPER